MSRRLFLNMGLLAVVAALGFLVWFDPGGDPGGPEGRLTDIAADQVLALTIRRPDGEALRFTRAGEGWQMEAPIEVEANGFLIDPLVGIVAARTHATFDAAGSDLERYGLRPPRARLAIDGRDIGFGDTEPIDHRRYVLFDDRVHLIDDHHFHRLQAGLTAFVSMDLLPRVRRLRIIDLPGLLLRRDDDGRWTAEPAQALSGEAAALAQEWLGAQGIEVVRFVAGGETAEMIRIGLEGGDTIRFEVLDDGDGLLLARRDLGIAWRLTDTQARRLLPQASDADEGDP